MALNLTGRKISHFRCHIDPSIPPSPKNAFAVGIPGSNIEFGELTPAGVYVKTKKEQMEFLIPYANVQHVKLLPEEKPVEPKKEK